MTDTHSSQDSDRPDDQELDRLLLQIAREDQSSEAWPTPETIVAYLHGSASESEQAAVRGLLLRSGAFRRYMAETGELLRGIQTPEAARQFEQVQVPKLDQIEPTLPSPLKEDTSRWRSLLRQYLRPRILIPMLSASAALVLMLRVNWSVKNATQYSLTVVSEVNPAFFMSTTTRGMSTESGQFAFVTGDSAALHAFRQVLNYDFSTGEMELDTSIEDVSGYPRTVEIHVVGGDGQPLGLLTLSAGAEYAIDSTGGQVWFFDLNTSRLWHADIAGRKPSIQVDSAMSLAGLFTVCYPVSGGFATGPARFFSLGRY